MTSYPAFYHLLEIPKYMNDRLLGSAHMDSRSLSIMSATFLIVKLCLRFRSGILRSGHLAGL